MKISFKSLFPLIFPVLLVAAYVASVIDATAAVQPPVGEVEDANGHTWGRGALGKKHDKISGDLVARDEVVGTGVDSAMTMRFIDNTSLTLGANAEIVVDDMVFNPDDHDGDVVNIRLGKGTFYFISGKVAKEKVTLVTPTATIGIRGTELVITVDEKGETSVGVAKGRAFMRSRRDGGGDVEIDTGHTARTSAEGDVSDSFPGVDLTGDEDVDRNIAGYSEWEDEREENGGLPGEGFDFEGEDDDHKDDRFAEHDDKEYDADRDDFEEADFAENENDDEDSVLARLFGREKKKENEEGEDKSEKEDGEGFDFKLDESDGAAGEASDGSDEGEDLIVQAESEGDDDNEREKDRKRDRKKD